MMNEIKEKVADASETVIDTTKNVSHKIAEKVEQTADWVKDKVSPGPKEGTDSGVAGIRERMDVIASCGKKVGVVDHVEAGAIKLTRKDSADGQHHFVPTGWVDHVDSHVHLKKNSVETEQSWKMDAAACGCGG